MECAVEKYVILFLCAIASMSLGTACFVLYYIGYFPQDSGTLCMLAFVLGVSMGIILALLGCGIMCNHQTHPERQAEMVVL